MGRRALILILSLLPFLPAAGQVRGWAGLPDRILSSTRLGKMSARTVPALPVWDDTPVTFAPDGARPVSADFDFANYLLDNGLRHDALTLVRGSFAPSDTLDYLRGWVLFGDRKLSQASAFLGRVPASSVFYDKSLFYNVVSLANLGDYARAASLLPAARPAHAELAAVEGAGLALLSGRPQDWPSLSSRFTFQDYNLAEAERVLTEIYEARFASKQKSPWLAALASAVLPGAGKFYAGRAGEGAAALLGVGSLAAMTAEQWRKHGPEDWRTLAFGALCATFWIGNIYGSYMSVSIQRNEILAAQDTAILYHLHLPLRSIFR